MEGKFRSSQSLRDSGKRQAVRERIVGNKDVLRICCFTEAKDDHVMWAHYADQFSGMCVSYSFSRLLKNLGDDIEFTRMSYRETIPTIRYAKNPSEESKKTLSCKNYRWA